MDTTCGNQPVNKKGRPKKTNNVEEIKITTIPKSVSGKNEIKKMLKELKEEIKDSEQYIEDKKLAIKESESLIKKYNKIIIGW